MLGRELALELRNLANQMERALHILVDGWIAPLDSLGETALLMIVSNLQERS